MKILTYSDDVNARQPLLKSAADYGFDVESVAGEFRFYKDWETRAKVLLSRLEQMPEDEVICITDAHDVFVNAPANVMKKIYDDNYEGKLVFQSEHQVWPDFRLAPQILEKHKDPDGYSYPCFGCAIGPVRLFVELYREVFKHGHVDEYLASMNGELTWPFDDQLALSKLYPTTDWIVIDSACVLFQSMQAPALPDLGIGQHVKLFLVNKKKNTRPCIVHGHGPVGVKKVYFDVLEKLGYK